MANPNLHPTFSVSSSILTQGTTSTPSVVEIIARKIVDSASTVIRDDLAVRVQICNSGTFTDSTNATIAPTAGYGTTIDTHTSTKDLTISSAASASAVEILTLTGVAIDGETVTLGSQVYEFDTDSSVTGDNVAVDISSYATASQGTLTIAEPVTAGDSVQIGTKTYIFVANGDGDSDGEIDLGADEAATKVNIVAAINGTDAYSTANADVSAAAFSGDACVLTALVPGTAGDALASAEFGQGLTHASNIFDAATLGTTTAGVDCTAANAITALAAAITADGDAVVTAVDGAGDTVDITAATAGAAGNLIASTETMANGSFSAATLAGGADNVAGRIRVSVTDATAETVTLRVGPAAVSSVDADYNNATQDITHAA